MAVVETLEILMPGPLTTVQDLGRHGFGRYGVPPSGALDAFSTRIANLLVENDEGEAALEITLMGLKARALTEVAVAVTGGDLQPRVNGEPLEMWRSRVLKPGDTLFFKGVRSGCRACLAVGGGIAADPVLGSKSTNLSSGFGGLEGRPLKKGDRLLSLSPHLHLHSPARSLREEWIPRYGRDWLVRVLPGPQHGDFPVAVRRLFVEAEFTVTSQADRTGIRMSGPPIVRRDGLPESIISEGVVPGAIQVPGDAQPIIILTETVTGGYRKIATVISADLPLLAQMRPGDRVRFREVSMDQAAEALRGAEMIIDSVRNNPSISRMAAGPSSP
ncbi:MAG: biotin-dependent carboxyltransferase family protein [Deltaproteobacteria bacterium]|nr:biotin-dependent carboxyltransferase family protein [Deltaproteobacteria bacterium]